MTLALAPRDRLITIPDGVPEFTLGWEAIFWACKYLRQPDGPHAGERWDFIESQVRFVLWWYAVDARGRWIYYHGVRRYPKGAGKSPFAAVLSMMELLGPVRLDHFDPKVPGGCIGRKVSMPLVQIAATSHDQANINTMRMVRALLPKGSRLLKDYDIEAGKTIFHTPGGGQLMVITSSPTTEEGALTTFCILDQTEAFYPTNGGVDLAEVMDRNVGKSGSRILETSNAWEPGRESVAETTYDAWCAQEEGRLRGGGKILYDSRLSPPDVDFEDTDSIKRGVQFAYGDAYWVNVDDIVENRILSPRTPLDVSKRYYLNWPESPEDAWTTQQKWARMSSPNYYIEDGSDIAMGFDGSRVADATALIGCHIETGFVFELGVWETVNRRFIPMDEVDYAVRQAKERFHVSAFFADVKEWEESTKISWRELFEDSLDVWAVPGGRDPQPVAWDMRSHVGEFTQAAEMVLSEIDSVPQGFIHDGSGALGRHVTNARRRPNRFGVSIGKESPKSVNKIDACVAMIIARHARRLVLASKDYKERRESAMHKTKARIWSFS
jgi:phage terminase large subunit-like protein